MIHQGDGFDGQCHLVIANVGDGKQVVDYTTFVDIKQANGRNKCPSKDGFPQKLYLCGNVELTSDLKAALKARNIDIFETNNIVDLHTERYKRTTGGIELS